LKFKILRLNYASNVNQLILNHIKQPMSFPPAPPCL